LERAHYPPDQRSTLMQVAVVQTDIVWEDKPASHAHVDALLKDAAIEPGGLIVLPEYFSTGFSLNVPVTNDDPNRASWTYMSHTARRCGAHVIGCITTTGSHDRGRNEAIVFNSEGQEITRYSKTHPFSHGDEDKHIEPGDELVTFACGGFMAAPFICYDLRFPEIFRAVTRQGAQLLVVMANWPEGRQAHWTALLKARAIENQAYVVAANRCGSDPNLNYVGGSIVVDPHGDLLADAGAHACVITADIDPQVVADWRATFPVLDDMRPEFLPDAPVNVR